MARADEMALLKLSRDGDPSAFSELAGPYRAELRAHCSRMLGSLHDAKEALPRAWKSLPGFEGLRLVHSWLYAIVTNAALDIARHRSRPELPAGLGRCAGPGAGPDPSLTEPLWLEPYPDRWLAHDAGPSPEARYEQRESIELAFLAALHQLSRLQRAVLLLREVVGFSTAEIASQLGTTAPSVNSALQRASAAARSRLPACRQQSALRSLGDQRARALVERYADAIERGDPDMLVSMLAQDTTWFMPPVPTRYRHHAIRLFLVRSPLTDRWRDGLAQANAQLSVVGYLVDPAKGSDVPAVIDVLTLDGTKIATVIALLTAERPQPPARDSWITGAQLFSRLGLPDELP
jgi:RNA polymerase sigma-70 factor (ECF subfamily)